MKQQLKLISLLFSVLFIIIPFSNALTCIPEQKDGESYQQNLEQCLSHLTDKDTELIVDAKVDEFQFDLEIFKTVLPQGPNLKKVKLDFSYNQNTGFDQLAGAFEQNGKINNLELSFNGNKIGNLQSLPEILKPLTEIELLVLNFQENEIESIEELKSALEPLEKLQKLTIDISRNENLADLSSLDFSNNPLVKIKLLFNYLSKENVSIEVFKDLFKKQKLEGLNEVILSFQKTTVNDISPLNLAFEHCKDLKSLQISFSPNDNVKVIEQSKILGLIPQLISNCLIENFLMSLEGYGINDLKGIGEIFKYQEELKIVVLDFKNNKIFGLGELEFAKKPESIQSFSLDLSSQSVAIFDTQKFGQIFGQMVNLKDLEINMNNNERLLSLNFLDFEKNESLESLSLSFNSCGLKSSDIMNLGHCFDSLRNLKKFNMDLESNQISDISMFETAFLNINHLQEFILGLNINPVINIFPFNSALAPIYNPNLDILEVSFYSDWTTIDIQCDSYEIPDNARIFFTNSSCKLQEKCDNYYSPCVSCKDGEDEEYEGCFECLGGRVAPQCEQCYPGFFLASSDSNGNELQPTQYQCQKCHSSCLTCENGNSCTGCLPPFELVKNQCVCNSGYYIQTNEKLEQQCLECPYPCKTCDLNKEGGVQCNSCVSDFTLFNTKEVSLKETKICIPNEEISQKNYKTEFIVVIIVAVGLFLAVILLILAVMNKNARGAARSQEGISLITQD